MDIFLVFLIGVGVLILLGVLGFAAKSKGAGCLPLLLLGALTALAFLALALLD